MEDNKMNKIQQMIADGAAGLAEIAKEQMASAMREAEAMGPDQAKFLKEQFEKAGIDKQVEHVNSLLDKLKNHISG